ncbi:hemicentin-1 isoform X2 [Mastacembelus armatus]|uniref:hemicentin-1 isoform X2 n=1 Tax=Mastacembelus armatus TaxID=205130 RepID=UPI000E45419E|nr:hemicentin-1-like isoform X2 [Mastacembelus armatus]
MLHLRMAGLLMLMFLLYDVVNSCPAALDPLSLDPPVVIKEYDEGVEVNCTTTLEKYQSMNWRDKTGDRDLEEEFNFVTWSVPPSKWDVTATCKIKLNSSVECSKDLEIIVYKKPNMVAIQPINDVKEGTQHQIQCDIIDVAPVQNVTLIWYKNEQNIKMETFNNKTKTPVNVSSFLSVNVNRKENGARFRCEAHMAFGPRQLGHVTSDTYTLSVHYAPELNVNTDYIVMEEGKDLTLNCEAEGNPPPNFHWTRNGKPITGKTNKFKITKAKITTTYSCNASNYLGSVTKEFGIRVIKIATTTAAVMTTHETSAPTACPLMLTPNELVVRFGDRASINCSTSAADAAGMGWEVPIGGTGFEKPPSVIWTIEKLEEWTIDPKCYITLKNDHQCSVMPKVTIYKTPDSVSVSALTDGPMVEDKQHVLQCEIVSVAGVPNLTVTWYRNGNKVQTETFNSTCVSPCTVNSTLRVTAQRDYNGINFHCEAELNLGPEGPKPNPTSTSEPYIAIVHYKPLIKACPSQYAGLEDDFSIDKVPCQADGNPPPTLNWYYQGKLINASAPLTRTESGRYTAEFVNDLDKSSTFVDVTVEYGPSFICNERYEVVANGKLQQECKADGVPAPNILWIKNGKEMAMPQRWTKNDTGHYKLKATNKHGSATYMLYLDVLFAPKFKEQNSTKHITPGDNVTLDCHAEGNPEPVIYWNYSSAENVWPTTRGHHSSIIVRGATSTNAGVYMCVATNKVGSVTRRVTLMMTGKSTASFMLWWVILLICILLLIILLMIIYHKFCKNSGQYSFINNKESTIPLSNVPPASKP